MAHQSGYIGLGWLIVQMILAIISLKNSGDKKVAIITNKTGSVQHKQI